MKTGGERNVSSFRDPSGFIFSARDILYRQVNPVYKDNYERLMESGLYQELLKSRLMVSHDEVETSKSIDGNAYKVIKPQLIPFISYPYEWCFSQLKDAALTTLEVQKRALRYGMSLKDASAYNIQFLDGKPILIDTLSFEGYQEGKPWIAYRQFCQHFLAPLALMSYRDIRLSQLLRIYIDGIPLDLASSLLPLRTRFSFSTLTHIHLHANSQKRFEAKPVDTSRRKMSTFSLLGLIDSLEGSVRKMKWRPEGTEWGDYQEDTSYSSQAVKYKKRLVAEYLEKNIQPRNLWDLGGNIGVFSRIASELGIATVTFDMDPVAVEKNYLECVRNGDTKILPLLLDLTNPTPDIGWENEERMSFLKRGPVDAVLALALVHHLAISNNLPLNRIASFLRKICRSLIIEFVPKSDPQVKRLLSTREDIFQNYNPKAFEQEFKNYFRILKSETLIDSERVMYLMEARE